MFKSPTMPEIKKRPHRSRGGTRGGIKSLLTNPNEIIIFLSLTLRYGYIYDISSPQTAVMAIWGL